MNIAISDAATLAIHALAYLANQQDSKPISTGKVAEAFGFSEAHLSKVFQRLNKSGFLKSVRGLLAESQSLASGRAPEPERDAQLGGGP